MATTRPALKPVALPDLSNAAQSVQTQLRARHAALTAAIDKPDTTATMLADAYGEMGKLFLAGEYYGPAAACFDNARALAPGDMRWPYYLGHVFRLENDPVRAAAAFEQALAARTDHVPSLIWLAEMHLVSNRADAAEPLLTRAQSLQPASAAVLHGLGRVALAKQQYAQAVTYLERALAADPAATRVHYPLAMAYRGLGQRARAEDHLRQRGTGETAPSDPLLGELANLLQNASAYEVRGSKALEARQWPEAVAQLSKAVELAPDNASTRLNLGTALYMQGDAEAALRQYREAIRLSPSFARAHFVSGVVLESQGRDREAIDAFTAAITSDPANAEARFSLAEALRRNGRIEESLTHYAEILRLDASASPASFGYAMALIRLGRYRDARDRLEAAVKTFPEQLGFAHALARVLAAAPDDRVRDGARAHALTMRLLKTQRSTGLAETMAMALAELGRFEEAVKWQREAITLAGQTASPNVVARLTQNLQLYGRREPCRIPWADDDPVHHPRPAS